MAEAMGYYDSEENVEAYIKMADGYDGANLIAILAYYLPAGASVLELGMGPGKDLDLLRASYTVTGSDSSQVFLDRYTALHPEADVLLLDAVDLDTDRTFDGVYSNKVLHHLTSAELDAAFKRQSTVFSEGGIALHSFWYGTGEEIMHGLRFTYYNEASLRAVVGEAFEILALERYGELEEGDSLYIVLRKGA